MIRLLSDKISGYCGNKTEDVSPWKIDLFITMTVAWLYMTMDTSLCNFVSP